MDALPLKYRPQLFSELVGQAIPAAYLATTVKRQQPRNVILEGAWGSGKSSAGRIYARALNCKEITSEGEPCNECSHCVLFMQERMPDYHEFDLSSKGRVEDVRQLVEIAKTPPTMGKYRVILGDEAHNCSKNAWDALLKLTEEPPPHLVFIFATTEGHKVRSAIRSRCRTLKITIIETSVLAQHVAGIAARENIPIEMDAVTLIAEIAKGHARDALTYLEQAWTSGATTKQEIIKVLGLEQALKTVVLAEQVIAGKLGEVLTTFAEWLDTPAVKRGLLAEYFVYLALTDSGLTVPVPHPALELVGPARHVQLLELAGRVASNKKVPRTQFLQRLAAEITRQPVLTDQATALAAHAMVMEFLEVALTDAQINKPNLVQKTRRVLNPEALKLSTPTTVGNPIIQPSPMINGPLQFKSEPTTSISNDYSQFEDSF